MRAWRKIMSLMSLPSRLFFLPLANLMDRSTGIDRACLSLDLKQNRQLIFLTDLHQWLLDFVRVAQSGIWFARVPQSVQIHVSTGPLLLIPLPSILNGARVERQVTPRKSPLQS